ncbi:MAG: peptide-methionine (S)-S-oxide reductase MsrA [Saprospiraceae bacterium]|nr:peptide-methionine (S)-S-oxide reductase MsrA [Saprospiraceae bacterium]
MKKFELTTFGAGCFWCIEAVFQDLIGVNKTISGYSGGHTINPTYRSVCTGTTGHIEVVQIQYDPSLISYEILLEALWHAHDPTQLNRQGNDIGTQYRSAILYHNEQQKIAAEKSIKEASVLFKDKIVTEIIPFNKFYPAENYHNDFFKLNGSNPYCSSVIAPKIKKFRKKFAHILKD